MIYLVNVDQRNLLKRKGMSYIVKQHMYIFIEDAREVTHVILMLPEEQG